MRRSLKVILALAICSLTNLPQRADAAAYGSVLIPGSAWAGSYANLGDLNVYSNGGVESNSQPGPYGGRYQCTELAQRWLSLRWGEPRYSHLGAAHNWWQNGPYAAVPLLQHPNGGADPPQFGDILVFDATAQVPTGHVAIVQRIAFGRVYIVEQNSSATTGWGSYPISGTTIIERGGLPILGWLRPSPRAYAPSGTVGGYTLDGWGGLHPWGKAPYARGEAYWRGWDIARAVVRVPGTYKGYVLDGWGGIHPYGGAAGVATSAYWRGWDIARGMALRSDGVSGYVLDGFGGVHPFGGAPPVTVSAYWKGWDIARGITLRADGVSGYVLDGWGGIHPFGGAPPVSGTAYWRGWDIARAIVMAPGTNGGYVLDGWGNTHPFNGATPLKTRSIFPNSDLGRGLVLSDTTTGYVGYANGAVSALGYTAGVSQETPGLPIVRGIA